MVNFFESMYEPLVKYAPYITMLGFLGFYSITIRALYLSKEGSNKVRYSFLLLLMALLPNFLAHISLAVVHGAWSPLMAEVVNIVPVVITIVLNEWYMRNRDKYAHVDNITKGL